MTPRAVFDSNVFLQAAGRPNGPAGRCFALAEAGAVELIASGDTRAEAADVLDRPVIRRKFKTLTDVRVAAFLATLDRVATRIDPVPAVVTLARDPKDEKYLNLAAAAGAGFVVSRDYDLLDLLDLMTGTDADAVAFRAAHPTISILDPIAFLQAVAPPPPTAPTP